MWPSCHEKVQEVWHVNIRILHLNSTMLQNSIAYTVLSSRNARYLAWNLQWSLHPASGQMHGLHLRAIKMTQADASTTGKSRDTLLATAVRCTKKECPKLITPRNEVNPPARQARPHFLMPFCTPPWRSGCSPSETARAWKSRWMWPIRFI